MRNTIVVGSRLPHACWRVLVVCLTLAPLAACTPPPQNYLSVPVCDSVDVNCRCKLDGWILCDGTCVDPKVSHDNCGACGNGCGGGVCMNGTCAASCGSTQMCGNACVDLMNDLGNCGACGNVCESDQICSGGTCVTPCPAGNIRCKGLCVDPQSDIENCGACGNFCPYGCMNGSCQCLSDQTNCNGDCVDITSDSSNCGGCGYACGSGLYCLDGSCQQ